MKLVKCPYCKGSFQLPTKILAKSKAMGLPFELKCPLCNETLKGKISQSSKEKDSQEKEPTSYPAMITALESDFGYKFEMGLNIGTNGIGRKNKDTDVDCPIPTADPSMGRHHCIITIEERNGIINANVKDDDSLVGTFLNGQLIGDKEIVSLTDGDVITLGATNLIFHINNQAEKPII